MVLAGKHSLQEVHEFPGLLELGEEEVNSRGHGLDSSRLLMRSVL